MLDPHFDSVLVLLRWSRSEVWASTMSKSVLMGRNNTMARDHTLRCFGRTLSHGEVSTPLPSIPTSVLHMMVETILKLAMLRMTLILVKTEISRPAQVRQFQIMVFAWFGKKAMYKIINCGYFHGCLNLRVPYILDHGAAESSKCFFVRRKALCTTFDSEMPTALSTTVAQSH